MSKNVVYVGPDDVRRITAADWSSLGITGMGDTQWDKSNSFEQLVTDAAAAYLLAQGEFVDEAGLTFPGVIDGLSGAAAALQGEQWSFNMLWWNAQFTRTVITPAGNVTKAMLLSDSIGELSGFTGAWDRLTQLVPGQTYGSGWQPIGGTFGLAPSVGTAAPAGAGAGPDGWGRVMNSGVDTGNVGGFVVANGTLAFYGIGTFDIYINSVLQGGGNTVLTLATPYEVSGVSLLFQTIRIVSKANGSIFHGVYTYYDVNAKTGGFQIWQFTHSGWTTQDFNTNTDTMAFVSSVNPDLVVFETGINDDGAGAAAYDTRMRTLIASVKALKPFVSVALWLPHQGGTSHPNNAAIVAKGLAICKDFGYLAMNFREVMGSTTTGQPAGSTGLALTSDGVHFSTLGQQLNWTFVYQMLSKGIRTKTRPLYEGNVFPTVPLSDVAGGATIAYVKGFANGGANDIVMSSDGGNFNHARVWLRGASSGLQAPRFNQVERQLANAGEYVVPNHSSRTTLALVVNTEYAIPIWIAAQNWGLTELGFELTTVGTAGAVVRVLLRDGSGTAGRPGNKVANAESATIATDAGVGAKTSGALTAANLAEGVYYLCIVAQVAACTVRASATFDRRVSLLTTFPVGAAPVMAGGYTKTGVSGVPATAYGTPAAVVDTAPLVGFKSATILA